MIDWSQLDALRAELGASFDELVEVFLEEMDTALARLDGAAPPAQMAMDLHFLKGSALNLGFAEFARLCAAGEATAANGGRVDPQPVRAAYAESRRAFLAGLAERRAA